MNKQKLLLTLAITIGLMSLIVSATGLYLITHGKENDGTLCLLLGSIVSVASVIFSQMSFLFEDNK